MSIKRTTKFAALAISTMGLFVAGEASADPVAAPDQTTKAIPTVLQKIHLGALPRPNITQNSGTGVVDTHVNFYGNTVAMLWTGSDSTVNQNSNNSYMRGQFAIWQLTDKGLEQKVAPTWLTKLNGDRAFMRPNVIMTHGGKYAVMIGASEDNGINNNPMPVAFVVNTQTGQLVTIKNNTRGQNSQKATNLVQAALNGGFQVNNPNNQRGPHSVCAINDTDILIGQQYNNQRGEVVRLNIVENADGSVNANVPYIKTFEANSQHARPMIACPLGPATAPRSSFVMTTVNANTQPANVGVTVAIVDPATGNTSKKVLAAASNPGQNIYMVQPSVTYVNDKYVALQWQMSAKTPARNNGNAHKGGSNVSKLAILDSTTLAKIDEKTAVGVASSHADSCSLAYGANGEAAVGVISGSRTGTGAGHVMVHPVGADGKIAEIDRLNRVFQVAKFTDVGQNVVRGKRNPNNQGRGFVKCTGGFANPGFGKGEGAFMPDVKSFTLSLVSGFDTEARQQGQGDKPYAAQLALIPASWDVKVNGVPGPVVEGNDPSTKGPLPSAPAPQSNGGADGDDGNGDNGGNWSGYDNFPAGQQGGGGCSTSGRSGGAGGFALIGVAVGLAALVGRRKKA